MRARETGRADGSDRGQAPSYVATPAGRVALFHQKGPGAPVIYVHGATFPTALSIRWGFGRDGTGAPGSPRSAGSAGSWMENLVGWGLDVYGFDFLGYGTSDRWQNGGGRPLGRVNHAVGALEAVVAAVRAETESTAVSLLAHSWGTLVAGQFASQWPEQVQRLVLFGPIARRRGEPAALDPSPTRDISIRQQWDRFQSEVPEGVPPVFPHDAFDPWAAAYLATDSGSGRRSPPAVRVPAGPFCDIAAAHAGHVFYEPAAIRAPVLVVRGAWDTLAGLADTAGLVEALTGAASVDHVVLSGGTHVMHLESGRHRLWRVVGSFLTASSPTHWVTDAPTGGEESR